MLISKIDRQVADPSAAADTQVMNRLDFEVVCPNNHNQKVTLSEAEFENALKSDALVFHCNTCEANWPPSSEEIANFRKQFSKNSG